MPNASAERGRGSAGGPRQKGARQKGARQRGAGQSGAGQSGTLQNGVVYATGLVQGIALVTFPAASAVLTGRSGFGLSSSEYGAMFVPQVLAAIAGALFGGRFSQRFGLKRVYLAGLLADLLAMLVLAGSSLLSHDHTVAYLALLLATALLGAGFGLMVPTLNTLVAAFHPTTVDRSTLVLNALLGLGTALAPVFVAVFVGLGFWWGLPLLAAVLLLGLGALAVRLPLTVVAPAPAPAPASASASASAPGPVPGAAGSHARRRIPPRFWLYAAAALLYGIVETMSGNWGQLQITGGLHGTAAQASLALAAFWAMATLGRVLFAVLQRRVPARWIYRMIPLVVAVAYLVVLLGAGAGAGAGSGAGAGAAGAAAAGSAGGSVVLGIVAFGLAGLGCSALLPFTLSFAEEQLSSNNSITGGLIATYQAGYGVAAFGVGPLLSGGVSLAAVFGAAGVVAVVLCGVAFVLTSRRFTHSSS